MQNNDTVNARDAFEVADHFATKAKPLNKHIGEIIWCVVHWRAGYHSEENDGQRINRQFSDGRFEHTAFSAQKPISAQKPTNKKRECCDPKTQAWKLGAKDAHDAHRQ